MYNHVKGDYRRSSEQNGCLEQIYKRSESKMNWGSGVFYTNLTFVYIDKVIKIWEDQSNNLDLLVISNFALLANSVKMRDIV